VARSQGRTSLTTNILIDRHPCHLDNTRRPVRKVLCLFEDHEQSKRDRVTRKNNHHVRFMMRVRRCELMIHMVMNAPKSKPVHTHETVSAIE